MSISPYLTFENSCEEAFNFYAKAFGCEISFMTYMRDMPAGNFEISADEKDLVMHATLTISEGYSIMGSDSLTKYGKPEIGNNFSISVNLESLEKAKNVYLLLAEGGKANMPIEKTFWGSHFGMLEDKFGIRWMINFQEEKTKSTA